MDFVGRLKLGNDGTVSGVARASGESISAMKPVVSLLSVAAGCLFSCAMAYGHHSGSEYDRSRVIEIEGKLLEIAWQNPHVHFSLRSTDASGKVITWDIEANSLSILRRTDATPENL